eukprot:9467298-Pyramimonas_sp.AAC.2
MFAVNRGGTLQVGVGLGLLKVARRAVRVCVANLGLVGLHAEKVEEATCSCAVIVLVRASPKND